MYTIENIRASWYNRGGTELLKQYKDKVAQWKRDGSKSQILSLNDIEHLFKIVEEMDSLINVNTEK